MVGVVIDDVQYEKCDVCSSWTQYELLRYEEPSRSYQYGRDLCEKCASRPGGAPRTELKLRTRTERMHHFRYVE